MGMIKEFKEFALGGSLVDMAVGIVMGGAIGNLVGSLVSNLINPIVGLFMGGTPLTSLAIPIGERKVPRLGDDGEALKDSAGEVLMKTEDLMLNYGAFIDAFIQFLILAFVIFIIVKMVNTAKKRMIAEAPAGPTDTELLTEIRDALKR